MIPNPVGTREGADRGTHSMKEEEKSLRPAGGLIEDCPAFEACQDAELDAGVLQDPLQSIHERLALLEMNQIAQMESAHHDHTRISRCEAVLGIHSKIEPRYLSDSPKEDDELPF